jgi:hypothetical protein
MELQAPAVTAKERREGRSSRWMLVNEEVMVV